MKFLILNGPNINLARWSEPGVPGEVDYNGLMDYVQAGCDQLGIETDICQSANHEGDFIDEIQSAPGRVDGIATYNVRSGGRYHQDRRAGRAGKPVIDNVTCVSAPYKAQTACSTPQTRSSTAAA